MKLKITRTQVAYGSNIGSDPELAPTQVEQLQFSSEAFEADG